MIGCIDAYLWIADGCDIVVNCNVALGISPVVISYHKGVLLFCTTFFFQMVQSSWHVNLSNCMF